MENKYNTENIFVRFDDTRKEIFIEDKKDIYNGTSAYNTKKRGYKKYKEVITSAISLGDRSSFWQWIKVANEVYKLNMHTYCAVD